MIYLIQCVKDGAVVYIHQSLHLGQLQMILQVVNKGDIIDIDLGLN